MRIFFDILGFLETLIERESQYGGLAKTHPVAQKRLDFPRAASTLREFVARLRFQNGNEDFAPFRSSVGSAARTETKPILS